GEFIQSVNALIATTAQNCCRYSFPTRRSSDLFNGADIVDTEKPGLWGNIEAPIGQVTGPVDVCEVNHHGKTAMSAAFIAAVTPRDRKSTRLNSSHVKISYAVFCLKKKTQTTRK